MANVNYISLENRPASTQKMFLSRIRKLFPNWSAFIGVLMVLVVIILSIAAPLIAPYDPEEQNIKNAFIPPSWEEGGSPDYLLGTDALGRDLYSRIIFGLRTSLAISVSAVILLLTIGVSVGLVAGYYGGGFLDNLLMRLTDIQMALPFIVLAITILSVFEPSIPVLIVVLALVQWPLYARVIRGMVLIERETDYILAAKAMGASDFRILTRYLLRNIIVAVLILSTLDMAAMIIGEATLSFMGLGVQPPTPSLGNIMADGRLKLSLYWWITTLPGVVIFFTILGLNLFGDGMQMVIDPKLRKR
ncbi:MAG: ABC transporter permease [Chloroflexi bacterium]|nr:ABC transporter permease [Chloroflexota bacterium]